MTKIPMTATGYSALEGELKHRIAVERPRLIQRVQEAIADDTNLADVRFTPESGHLQCNSACPLWANSGHFGLHGGCPPSIKLDTGQTIFQIQPIVDHHRPRLAGVSCEPKAKLPATLCLVGVCSFGLCCVHPPFGDGD